MVPNAKAAVTAAAPRPATTPSNRVAKGRSVTSSRMRRMMPDVGQRIERQVEAVGRRRRRRAGAPQGFDRPGDVPEGPGQDADADGDRRPLERAAEQGAGEAQPGGGHFESVDAPPVDDRPQLSLGVDDQHHDVAHQQGAQDGVGRRRPRDGKVLSPCLRLARSGPSRPPASADATGTHRPVRPATVGPLCPIPAAGRDWPAKGPRDPPRPGLRDRGTTLRGDGGPGLRVDRGLRAAARAVAVGPHGRRLLPGYASGVPGLHIAGRSVAGSGS